MKPKWSLINKQGICNVATINCANVGFVLLSYFSFTSVPVHEEAHFVQYKPRNYEFVPIYIYKIIHYY